MPTVTVWPVFPSWPHPEASHPSLGRPWKKLDVAQKGEASKSWLLSIAKEIKSRSERTVISEIAGERVGL